jgi:hypothetical protein
LAIYALKQMEMSWRLNERVIAAFQNMPPHVYHRILATQSLRKLSRASDGTYAEFEHPEDVAVFTTSPTSMWRRNFANDQLAGVGLLTML